MRKKIISIFSIIFYFLIAGFIFSGCGGGGSDSEPQVSGTWSGNVNAAGYPDVVGVYSFNVSAGSYVCTDGSSGTTLPLAMNMAITQNNNQLLLYNTSTSGPPVGTTVLQHDDLAGNVELNGNFILNQHIVMKSNTMPGNNSFTYTITGVFNPLGWSGTYQLGVYNDSYKVSCTYSAAFIGDRINQAPATEPSENEKESLRGPESIYDFQGMTSLLGS